AAERPRCSRGGRGRPRHPGGARGAGLAFVDAGRRRGPCGRVRRGGAPVTADLPLPDYDDLTTQGIGHRIRQLDRSGVEVLLAYEATHANRPAVVLLMRTRLAELEAGAKPSGGSPRA